jgi:hypothetical protein
MKRAALLVASALALAAPAFADPPMKNTEAVNNADTANAEYYTTTEKTDFQASDLIGSRVYATEASVDADQAIDKAGDDWDDIGEVNNLIVSRDGSVKAVVVGVGGFLGLGEKNVALKMGELKFLKKAGDEASDYFIVVNSNKARLEKAPEYKMSE